MPPEGDDLDIFGEDSGGLALDDAPQHEGEGDEGGFSLELDADGNPVDPESSDEGDEGGESGGGDENVTIKKADWDRMQSEFAEMRGFYTAKKGDTQQHERQQQQDDDDDSQRGRQQQQQRQAPPSQADFDKQLDTISDTLVDDLTSGDRNSQKGAIKKILTLGAQAGFNNAKALFGSMAPAQAQSIVDSYVNRKAAKDPLYDKGVGERFEEILGQYDTSVLVGQSRKVVMDTLDTMYQRAKGDWADTQYTKSEQRRQTQQRRGDTTPQNLGGGRSGQNGGGRRMQIPSSWVNWARQAGIPEDEMQDTFAEMVRNHRGRE